jgi:hypothetical protein
METFIPHILGIWVLLTDDFILLPMLNDMHHRNMDGPIMYAFVSLQVTSY